MPCGEGFSRSLLTEIGQARMARSQDSVAYRRDAIRAGGIQTGESANVQFCGLILRHVGLRFAKRYRPERGLRDDSERRERYGQCDTH
jgi:hypothetical protein